MSTTKTAPNLTRSGPTDSAPVDAGTAGWVLFAGILLAMLAALNLIDGIASVQDSKFFVNGATFILSDLNTWGWVLIVTGAVQALAAVGVWLKWPAVRWVGVGIAALNGIVQMMFISAYPGWAIALFTLDILVIYGLAAHGDRMGTKEP